MLVALAPSGEHGAREGSLHFSDTVIFPREQISPGLPSDKRKPQCQPED